MENPNLIFFGDTGLTAASANHIANLAKEYVQDIESKLNNFQLYRSSVALIGTQEQNVLSEGVNDSFLNAVASQLSEIANANGLIAWLREAIKAKTVLLKNVESMNIEEWSKIEQVAMPEAPVLRKSMTREQALANCDIKVRNHIYSLEAKAAVYGKFIHPDGKFAEARKEFLKKQESRHSVQENGRDTLIYTYEPTCSSEKVEEVFFDLQKKHRSVQAELNGLNYSLDEAVRSDKIAAIKEYNVAYSEYSLVIKELENRFEEYKVKEAERVANLYKIQIPHELKSIYEKVSSLGK